MSTRSQIAIFDGDISDKLDNVNFLSKKWQALIYRHNDGYPESVVEDILPLIKQFIEVRGFYDSEYLSACLVGFLKCWHSGMPFYKAGSSRNIRVNNFETDVLCHGISKQLHGDIEYLYCIDSKNLYVFSVSCWDKPYKFELLETHSIKEPVLVGGN